jgi:hypothetical protein
MPDELSKSLTTWDRGKELTDHKRFTVATDIDVYFCDPHSPWQRGSNENANRLLTGHHARLGTRLLAKLYRGGHPRPPNFMRFPRRNAPDSGRGGDAPLRGSYDPTRSKESVRFPRSSGA